jgi:hypothetical protein
VVEIACLSAHLHEYLLSTAGAGRKVWENGAGARAREEFKADFGHYLRGKGENRASVPSRLIVDN